MGERKACKKLNPYLPLNTMGKVKKKITVYCLHMQKQVVARNTGVEVFASEDEVRGGKEHRDGCFF